MKREVLFKAKRVDNGEWVTGFYSPVNVPIIGNMGHFINEGGFKAIEIDPETVCQFTGLLDKNGNKIFEGDKLKRLNGKIDIVLFDTGQFVIQHESGDTDYIAVKNNFEITGNIHDK